MSSYKKKFSLNQRVSESNRILVKYPSHVPVIVECDKKIGVLNKQKFLVPNDVSVSHLLISVRKQISLDKSQSIFMFCDNMILCPTVMMSQIYSNYLRNKKDEYEDKFLYITISAENTFGNIITYKDEYLV